MKKLRITPKLIREVIEETAGEDVVELATLLKKQDNYSEFKLAEELEKEVNIIRNKLYRLLQYNLVSFTRKKDKRKGWYITYWTFRTNEVKYRYKRLKEQKLAGLLRRLEREESDQFFVCESKCMRMSFDNATRYNFRCSECGELFKLEDNSSKIKEIKVAIKEVQKLLSTLA